MEQRRYPRIQLPLLVELKHPVLGHLRCIARDISEGGVFVYTDSPQFKPGAKVKVTLQNTLGSNPSRPRPSKWKSSASRATAWAWRSSTSPGAICGRASSACARARHRPGLLPGPSERLVINDTNAVLLVQQHGKWTLPASFLVVGRGLAEGLGDFLRTELGVPHRAFGSICAMSSVGNPELPEAAVLDVFVEARSEGDAIKLAKDSRYRAARWINRRRDIEETTFANERVRALVAETVKRLMQPEEEA
jgi:ADP-ribose pyrophosphatase YjhB (NUDIX family)